MWEKVVPPEQARTMVSTIEKAGGKVEAVYYEGEGHGFRKAENVKDSLDRTLAFFQKTFGLDQWRGGGGGGGEK
jgi:dipeptidyl aminopeptidase/acylaminoacyl peptidase